MDAETDLCRDLVRGTPIHNRLDKMLQSRQGFHQPWEFQAGHKDNRAGRMVYDVFDGIFPKRVVQGHTVG